MKRSVTGLSCLIIGLVAQLHAASFILTDAQEDDKLMAEVIKEAAALEKELEAVLQKVERGDFDQEALSIFKTEMDECEEVLLPWGVDETISEPMRSVIEKQTYQKANQSKPLAGKEFCDLENPYQPSFEHQETRPVYFRESSIVEALSPSAPVQEEPVMLPAMSLVPAPITVQEAPVQVAEERAPVQQVQEKEQVAPTQQPQGRFHKKRSAGPIVRRAR